MTLVCPKCGNTMIQNDCAYWFECCNGHRVSRKEVEEAPALLRDIMDRVILVK